MFLTSNAVFGQLSPPVVYLSLYNYLYMQAASVGYFSLYDVSNMSSPVLIDRNPILSASGMLNQLGVNQQDVWVTRDQQVMFIASNVQILIVEARNYSKVYSFDDVLDLLQ